MTLRAWFVFPATVLYPILTLAFGARLFMHETAATSQPGDVLVTIDLPFWWWPFVLGPPTLLLAAYFWQRLRASRSEQPLANER